MTEMFIAGAVLDTSTNTPVLVLMDREGHLALPIGIGELECNAICFAMAGLRAERPQSHDLLLNIIAALGWRVKDVELSEVKSETYISTIHLQPRDEKLDVELPIDARPSDAIAIAARINVPIHVSDAVINYGAVTIQKQDGDEAFHNFVENTKASDFSKWFSNHNP